MQCDIKIKSPTYPISNELIISHDADESILSLKGKIRDSLNNQALVESTQKLIYGGHVLEDHKTLTQLKIPSSATFHLVTPPHVLPAAQPILSTQTETDQSLSDRPLSPVQSAIEPAQAPSIIPQVGAPVDGASSAAGITSESVRPAEASSRGADSPIPGQAHSLPVAQPSSLTAFASETHSFLGRHEHIEQTGTNYVLCYIDGFPYLIKAADRVRHLRRSRRQMPIPTPTVAHPSPGTMTAGAQAPGQVVQQRHVDLPATAAIPVRTAEGRRALILSPEGVRAMAAQGVNVETGARGRPGALGVDYVSLRRFMSTGVPHGWLVLKLVFLVTMLGSNATWTRFMMLNFIAIGIFLWQSGILARILFGRPSGLPAAAAPATPAVQPAVGTNNDGDSSNPSNVPARAVVPPTLLQSFTNAFIASILPRNVTPHDRPQQVANVPRDPMHPQAAAVAAAEQSEAESQARVGTPADATQANTTASANSPDAFNDSTTSNLEHSDAREQGQPVQDQAAENAHLRRDW